MLDTDPLRSSTFSQEGHRAPHPEVEGRHGGCGFQRKLHLKVLASSPAVGSSPPCCLRLVETSGLTAFLFASMSRATPALRWLPRFAVKGQRGLRSWVGEVPHKPQSWAQRITTSWIPRMQVREVKRSFGNVSGFYFINSFCSSLQAVLATCCH